MTSIIETAKSLLDGTFSFGSTNSVLTIVWLATLVLVFSFLSLKRYKQIFVNI